jgi:hypothetical protein
VGFENRKKNRIQKKKYLDDIRAVRRGDEEEGQPVLGCELELFAGDVVVDVDLVGHQHAGDILAVLPQFLVPIMMCDSVMHSVMYSVMYSVTTIRYSYAGGIMNTTML